VEDELTEAEIQEYLDDAAVYFHRLAREKSWNSDTLAKGVTRLVPALRSTRARLAEAEKVLDTAVLRTCYAQATSGDCSDSALCRACQWNRALSRWQNDDYRRGTK
jgi:hypothetical protein